MLDSLKQVKEKASQETIVLNTNEINDTYKIENEDDNEEVREESTKEKTTEEVESVAEKLLKQKIELDIDDTQFIDTSKVRESLFNKEELPMYFILSKSMLLYILEYEVLI